MPNLPKAHHLPIREPCCVFSFKRPFVLAFCIFVVIWMGVGNMIVSAAWKKTTIETTLTTTARTTTSTTSPPKAAINAAVQPRKTMKILFVGNSFLYMNDTPGLLEKLLIKGGYNVSYKSCLKGAATLISLWTDGTCPRGGVTGTTRPMSLPQLIQDDLWDFVILQDQSQAPARKATRDASAKILEDNYAPLLVEQGTNTVPVILQTHAYRVWNVPGIQDLGNFDSFTNLLREGAQEYRTRLAKSMEVKMLASKQEAQKLQPPIIAPVGEAFSLVFRSNPQLWTRLYMKDNYHPSPHGTWLQTCVLYCTMTKETPPMYEAAFWISKNLQKLDPHSVMTENEAQLLRKAALEVCGIHPS